MSHFRLLSVVVRRSITPLVVGFACLAATPTSHAAAYTILDLGVPAGDPGFFGSLNTSSRAFALNNSGQVVGYAVIDNTHLFAFRTAPNQPITTASNLGSFQSPLHSFAYGINDGGQVVGESATSIGQDAFRTDANGVITAASDLGSLGGDSSYAWGINASGQVVGDAYTISGADHAFRTAANAPITAADDLGTLGGLNSDAYAINASGQAVGDSTISNITGNTFRHAFRTAADGPITAASDLGTLGGTESDAVGINSSGQAVGWADVTGSATAHAFRTSANGLIVAADDLGTLGGSNSGATAINDFGQVVGSSYLAGDRTEDAFFCDVTGPMQDLNNLIPANSGWALQVATGINNLGQISGFGTYGPFGQVHAFLLTPTPEPSSVALLALTCVALLRPRRRLVN